MPVRSEEGRVMVRMFAGFTGTVLWLGDAVDHSDVHLSPGLVADLDAWDAFHRSRLDPDLGSHAEADDRTFARTGAALADRLADELGVGFEVHLLFDGREVHRSSEPPTNPRAARALNARAKQVEAEAREIAASHPGGGWYAYAPLSGRRFTPSRRQRPASGTNRPSH
ncbi:hypothetical protein [Frigoribacterium sp. PhB118]|uniref:hypothetical protein n=1 Tax=Frigoribacterium sp. PhB118 TaxID=2485175 RepID=UPI000F47AA4B|nr:hypothetical protein [Frigoribacterium sp. PhB118]